MLHDDSTASEPSTTALLGQRQQSGAPVYVCTLVLANTILGAGMLGLPAAFGGCGYVVGTLMLCAFACASTFGLHLLSEAANFVGRPGTFHKVANAAMPGAGLLFDAAIAIKCFGVATSYLVVVKGNVPKALISLGVPQYSVWQHKWVWVLISAALAAPLAALKNLSRLRFTAGLSLTCVVLIVTVVCLFAAHPVDMLDPCPDENASMSADFCGGAVKPFTDGMSCLRELPIFVFAFTCHQNIISATNELDRPTTGRVLTSISGAVGLAGTSYLILAYSGYFTYGDGVASDVLESYPAMSKIVGVARMAISLIVTLCYPLQAHPSRGCITSILLAACAKRSTPAPPSAVPYQSFGMVNVTASGTARGADAAVPIASPPTDGHGGVQPTSNAMHYGITACFLAGTIAIALAIDDLGIVLKVVGATGSTTVSYILPGATYIRVCPRHLRGWQWWGALGMLLTGCAIMPISLTLDFLSE